MATPTLIPLADRVVVSIAAPKQSISGIILPESSGAERPERGVVTAVGKGRRNDAGVHVPLEVAVGDEVLFSQYGPETVTVDGTQFYILREDQILAIVK